MLNISFGKKKVENRVSHILKLISPSPIYPNDRAQVQKVHTKVLAKKKSVCAVSTTGLTYGSSRNNMKLTSIAKIRENHTRFLQPTRSSKCKHRNEISLVSSSLLSFRYAFVITFCLRMAISDGQEDIFPVIL